MELYTIIGIDIYEPVNYRLAWKSCTCIRCVELGPHMPVQSHGRSVAPTAATRCAARVVVRSRGRLIVRMIDRSIARSFGRSIDCWVA